MNVYPKRPALPVPKKQMDIKNMGQEMTLKKLTEMGLIDDNTEIVIREGEGFDTFARGNWYQDDILAYDTREVESFTWQDDNRLYIDLKV